MILLIKEKGKGIKLKLGPKHLAENCFEALWPVVYIAGKMHCKRKVNSRIQI